MMSPTFTRRSCEIHHVRSVSERSAVSEQRSDTLEFVLR
jgi:hypothetical protein